MVVGRTPARLAGVDEAANDMRTLLLLEGDGGAAMDRKKRPAMVSCGGDRER